MPIHRSSEQRPITLQEFYSENEMGSDYTFVGEQMLTFLQAIDELFPYTQLFGLTSHYRLVIKKEDRSASEWYIIVAALANEFYFEYLMPKDIAPWQRAYVRGTARSLEEAKRFLLIAMRECDGWKENEELKQRLDEYNLQRTTETSQNGS